MLSPRGLTGAGCTIFLLIHPSLVRILYFTNVAPHLCRNMKEMGEQLNLKPHMVGWSKAKLMYSAGDVEGHKGTDGRHYLLDFSRSMPPVDPALCSSPALNGHLYMLFRREFVKAYRTPLCSDGFSAFLRQDPEEKAHNEELREASGYLVDRLIPAFAREFLQIYREAWDSSRLKDIKITEHMHRRGINMRYLGRVFTAILMVESEWSLECGRAVLVEACARVVKNRLNMRLRHHVRQLAFPVDVSYRRLVLRFLNLVFEGKEHSQRWWAEVLLPALYAHFSFSETALSEEAVSQEVLGRLQRAGLKGKPVYSLFGRGIISVHVHPTPASSPSSSSRPPLIDSRVSLFRRVEALTGLRFDKSVKSKIKGTLL